jgi:hypothetical protein
MQTAGSTCEFWVNPVNFTFWAHPVNRVKPHPFSRVLQQAVQLGLGVSGVRDLRLQREVHLPVGPFFDASGLSGVENWRSHCDADEGFVHMRTNLA